MWNSYQRHERTGHHGICRNGMRWRMFLCFQGVFLASFLSPRGVDSHGPSDAGR